MSAPPQGAKVERIGPDGLQLACRENTVDERAARPWIEWLSRTPHGAFVPQPDYVVLDIGAHIGGFALAAAKRATRGRVLAVEACRETYEVLVHNVELNGLRNVEVSHLALSDHAGETRLYHDRSGNWGHTITKTLEDGFETVPTETLAGYLREHEVDRCDLAKLNCEGAEFPILLGTPAETLRTIKRMLVLYHCELVDERYSLEALEDHLERAGFSLKRKETSTVRGQLFAVQDE